MLRSMFLMLTAALAATVTATVIMIDGRTAFYDQATNTWLCSVPLALFGHDLTATFAVDNATCWHGVTIDGQPVTLDSLVTFEALAGDRLYHLTALDSIPNHGARPKTVDCNIAFTYLPVMRLTGAFNDNYQVAPVEVQLPEAGNAAHYLAKVKHRGGTTNLPNRNKRNYHLKFVNDDTTKRDCKFFGLRNDNSWILDAGQIDMLRIRNRVATELWLDMCRPPYYADREPKALSGVRGDFIEVFLGDRYQGIYALTEAMDRKQLKLAKYDQTDSVSPFRGMLWKVKATNNVAAMRTYYNNYTGTDTTWYGQEVKYPDPDDLFPTDFSTLANAIRFVAKSSHADFISHVHEYFDLPVIMDYWIMINALLAIDNGVKNIYWAVYDQQQDKKLTLAVWDLDCTTGQNWINVPFHDESKVGPERYLNYFSNLMTRLHEHNPDSFSVKAVERYRLLRNDLLSADSIYNRYVHRIDWLRNSGALAREAMRWSGDTDLSGNPLDFDGELAYIRQWLDLHLDFLDRTRFSPYIRGDVNRDGMVDIADVNFLVNKMVSPDDYPVWYEDVVRNFVIDISDVNAVLNVMLNRNQ